MLTHTALPSCRNLVRSDRAEARARARRATATMDGRVADPTSRRQRCKEQEPQRGLIPSRRRGGRLASMCPTRSPPPSGLAVKWSRFTASHPPLTDLMQGDSVPDWAENLKKGRKKIEKEKKRKSQDGPRWSYFRRPSPPSLAHFPPLASSHATGATLRCATPNPPGSDRGEGAPGA